MSTSAARSGVWRMPPEGREVRRPLADRVALRFPGLTPLATRIIFRLRPGSQLRRRLLVHYVGQSKAAMNRRDFDVYLLGWDTDVELEFSGDITMTGLATSYRGHDGYRAFWTTGCATGSRSPMRSRL